MTITCFGLKSYYVIVHVTVTLHYIYRCVIYLDKIILHVTCHLYVTKYHCHAVLCVIVTCVTGHVYVCNISCKPLKCILVVSVISTHTVSNRVL